MAQSPAIVSTTASYARFGADKSHIASGRGRKSVRLESTATYTKGIFVLDVNHMPGAACGAWPAYWTFGPNWPNNGEIGKEIYVGPRFVLTRLSRHPRICELYDDKPVYTSHKGPSGSLQRSSPVTKWFIDKHKLCHGRCCWQPRQLQRMLDNLRKFR